MIYAISADGKNYVIPIPDEWIVVNPIWRLLAPEMVAEAERRIAALGKDYNAYMRDWMRRKRESAKGTA